MRVERVNEWSGLQALQREWNALSAGKPLRSWDWLATWWTFYGRSEKSNRDLFVLAVYDDDATPSNDNTIRRLVGVAPWYIEQSTLKGRVLRWLGDGEVCTDHSSFICAPEHIQLVAESLASAVIEQFDDWDAIELDSVDSDDAAVRTLVAKLQDDGCSINESPADSYWAVDLPASWDEYLANNSKSHRKQLRQLERRVLEGDRVTWHRVQTQDELEVAWGVLVDLHQRRRKSLGEPGCFASQAFHDFHQQVAEHLLLKNQLRISWLELDGSPVAAEYHFAGSTTTYAYQGGVDPDRLADEPGRLSTILCLQQAIAEQHTRFDFLRGDEPYKAHWRATPHPTCNLRIVPARRLARIRGRVLSIADTLQDWARQAAELTSVGSSFV
ncbi:MAG TPA: GNAT family N-acetyltransferase [Lacipirellulaceae bacterium]|nr:GNAT family N-acetyltransferase [Lacipirellulaceae bacterium]